MTNSYWKQSEPGIEYKDRSVHVNRRMTEYESWRFKYKADQLLDCIQAKPSRHSYEIKRWVAYGNQRRIGAFMTNERDPLDNGIIVGNFDNFTVESVKPVDNDTVYIRFNYIGEIPV